MGQRIEGNIAEIDSFGNLVTSITQEQLTAAPRGESLRVACDGHETYGLFEDYQDQPPMTLVALVGDSGNLELAIVDESAAMMLGVRAGTAVTVTW